MNKWAYLFVYDDKVGTRDEIKAFLDSRPEILNWAYCMPHSFFLVSNRTASGIRELISSFNKNGGRFIIVDVKTDRDGWLPRSYWDWLSNPKGVNEK